MNEKKFKVLAVDDDIINLKLLKVMLSKSPHVYEFAESKNGDDAINVLKNDSDINLILLDIIMPVMGGLEMLKVVRADETLNHLPVIMLTTDETKKAESLEFGANGFIMKPVREKDLLEKIETLVNV